jgi:hypothetical protein
LRLPFGLCCPLHLRTLIDSCPEVPRVRVLFALICVLALATFASAVSAWVLWLGTGTGYTPFGAYGGQTGERECKEAIAQLMTEGEVMKGHPTSGLCVNLSAPCRTCSTPWWPSSLSTSDAGIWMVGGPALLQRADQVIE